MNNVRRRPVDKKRVVDNVVAKDEADSEDENMVMGDREEVGPNVDYEMEAPDEESLNVRLGGQYIDRDDERELTRAQAVLAGQKRTRRDFTEEEEEDMDFEAIRL